MTISRLHPDTAAAARAFAQEQLGVSAVRLRAPTAQEAARATLHGFDAEAAYDIVVAQSAQGREWLLKVDVDPAHSQHLNAESGVLTLAGLLPVIGAPVVGAFALKDLAKAGSALLKSRAQGQAADPRDRALLRMGVKHLGLAALSLATQGTTTAARLAHKAVMATEAATATKDLVEGGDAGFKGMPRAVVAGLQGILGVKHHEPQAKADARVIVVAKSEPELRSLDTHTPPHEAAMQRPESKTGPPPPG